MENPKRVRHLPREPCKMRVLIRNTGNHTCRLHQACAIVTRFFRSDNRLASDRADAKSLPSAPLSDPSMIPPARPLRICTLDELLSADIDDARSFLAVMTGPSAKRCTLDAVIST